MPRVSRDYLDRRREEILAAALRCFAREGFHRTTMQDIVAESGLSPGALYRYFAAKEDLIAAIAARHHAAELALLRDAAERADVRLALRALVRAFLERLSDPGEQEWRRVTVQLWGEALRSPRVMRVVREGLDEPLAALASLLRRVPGVDAAATARLTASLFQGLVLQQAWDPELDVAAYARAAESLIDAVLGAAPARHSALVRQPRSRTSRQRR
ncbi:MAG: TetR/AcrR family transcriptional regulator [Deltaproteobacteria bacterium]|nr:MAG: TetR/AcrR family transcriptional regulator [Deltaproteobacteria bacterium]